MKYDFSGYATKNNLKCTDGRIIRKDAFKDNDGQTVPLVWQHMHDTPDNILGHAILENRADGVYTYGKFNETTAGQNAKELVKHGDITALSIFANKLQQQGNSVLHGAIREVSLVMTGANPGACIDNLNFAHSDGTTEIDETEAVIYTGLGLNLEEETGPMPDEITHAAGQTVQDVFDSLTDIQKEVVYAMIGEILEDDSVEHSALGGEGMKKNVFDKETGGDQMNVLSHADWSAIVEDTKNYNGSLREAVMAHAATYGIEDIDFLFPDAQSLTPTPTFISRDMTWVNKVLTGVHHSPFSRIKSLAADITADEARAKGYIKGNLKKDEVFKLLKRVTTPKTIYKKQKLDRDDVIDITDFDVVTWMKMEMRMMLDEEIARAIFIGDGREVEDADKINEENVRPIVTDADLYSHKIVLPHDVKVQTLIDEIVKSRVHYKGKGSPRLYVSTGLLTEMLLLKDTLGRRLYTSKADLASALLVSDIEEVPVFNDFSRVDEEERSRDLLTVMVNLSDYNVGADKGGAVNLFDDFDIDYNQHKYLLETRISGALVNPKTAIVIEKYSAAPEPDPEG